MLGRKSNVSEHDLQQKLEKSSLSDSEGSGSDTDSNQGDSVEPPIPAKSNTAEKVKPRGSIFGFGGSPNTRPSETGRRPSMIEYFGLGSTPKNKNSNAAWLDEFADINTRQSMYEGEDALPTANSPVRQLPAAPPVSGAKRRGAANATSLAASVEEARAAEEARLAREAARQEAIRKEEAEERVRLEHEPELAKQLRKSFKNVENVSTLLDEIFNGSRFGDLKERHQDLLTAELVDELKKASIAKFESWKNSVRTPAGGFPKFDDLKTKIEDLSALWEEVFQYYGPIASDEDYPFSLQPLEKFRYFYEELQALSKVQNGFHNYMKSSFSEDFFKNQIPNIEKFIPALDLFTQRARVLRDILYVIKNTMEQNDKVQEALGKKKLRLKLEVPQNMQLETDKNPSQLHDICERYSNAVDQFKKHMASIVRNEDSLRKAEEDSDHTNQILYTEKLEAAKNKILKSKEALKEVDSLVKDWMVNLKDTKDDYATLVDEIATYEMQIEEKTFSASVSEKNIKSLLIEARKKLPAAKTSYEKAQRIADQHIQAEIAAEKEVQEEKAAIFSALQADLKEEIDRRASVKMKIQEGYSGLANKASSESLINYAADPSTAPFLRLTNVVEVPLPVIPHAIVEEWIGAQRGEIFSGARKHMLDCIAPRVRKLRFSLSVSTEDVEITLEDIDRVLPYVIHARLAKNHLEFSQVQQSLSASAQAGNLYNTLITESTNLVSPSDDSIHALNQLRAFDSWQKAREGKMLEQLGLHNLIYLWLAPADGYTEKKSMFSFSTGGRLGRSIAEASKEVSGFDLEVFKNISDGKMNAAEDQAALKLLDYLAKQAAALSLLDNTSLTPKTFFTNKELEISGKGNWFLQLRFIEEILIKNKKLSEKDTRERGALVVVKNVMNNFSKLADWITEFYTQTKHTELQGKILGMSEALKIKLTCLLVVEFFYVLFKKAEVSKLLVEAFGNIIEISGYKHNENDEGVLFGLASIFLLNHKMALLAGSRIQETPAFGGVEKGTQAELPNIEAQYSVKSNSGDSRYPLPSTLFLKTTSHFQLVPPPTNTKAEANVVAVKLLDSNASKYFTSAVRLSGREAVLIDDYKNRVTPH